MKKLGLVLIIIILFVGGYFLVNQLLFSSRSKISQEPIQDNKQQAETELQEATLTLYSQDQTTRWELTAVAVKRLQNSSQIALDQVTAQVYKNQQQIISLVAKQGEVDSKTGFLTLKGAITIKKDQKLIKADKLNWNQAQNQLIGRGGVVIKQPGLTITGDNFVSQVDLKTVQIIDNVRAISSKAGDANEQ